MPDFGYVLSFTIGDYEKIKLGEVDVSVYNSPTYRAMHKNSSMAFQAQIYRTKSLDTEIYYTLRFYRPAKHNKDYTVCVFGRIIANGLKTEKKIFANNYFISLFC